MYNLTLEGKLHLAPIEEPHVGDLTQIMVIMADQGVAHSGRRHRDWYLGD